MSKNEINISEKPCGTSKNPKNFFKQLAVERQLIDTEKLYDYLLSAIDNLCNNAEKNDRNKPALKTGIDAVRSFMQIIKPPNIASIESVLQSAEEEFLQKIET